jgi:long-subunit fatty acid transport protein
MAATPGLTFSQGVGLPETIFSAVIGSGARAFGMGGAFIAIADDATAASWNPAGLSQLEKPEVSVVFATNDLETTLPSVTFTSEIFSQSVSELKISQSGSNVDFLSFAYPFRIRTLKMVSQISYQRLINLSLDAHLDQPFIIREETPHPERNQPQPDMNTATINSGTINQAGGGDLITISVAAQISPLLSLGLAANYIYRGFEISQELEAEITETVFNDDDGDGVFDEPSTASVTDTFRDLQEGDLSGFNVNFGVMLKPVQKVSLGFIFRTPVTLNFKLVEDEAQGLTIGTTITEDAKIEYPYSFGLGLAVHPMDQLTLSSDFTWSNWSESKMTHGKRVTKNELGEITKEIIDDEPFPGNEDAFENLREQHDTNQFRVGAEYVFLRGSWLIPVRAGFFTNTLYITDGNEESITNLGYTVGIGVGIKDVLFDAAFVYQRGDSFFSEFSSDDRKFSSKQFYVSAIYRFDL